MQESRSNSYLFGGNAPYVEEMYEAYLDNPGSVPENWRKYFDALQNVPAVDGSNARDVAHAPVVESFAQRAKAGTFGSKASSTDLAIARKQVHVQSLIAAYRFLGSRWADLDPLKRQERPKIPQLEPAFYDLSESDMDIAFSATNTYFSTAESMTLREIVQALRETYCGSIGVEYMHVTEPNEKRWWQERLESIRSKPSFDAEQKKHILDRLTAAEGLERYLHTKYVGQKRFSLEGGESFIASMDELVQRAGAKGVQEIVIGMAHRGRLNVLVNTLGKMPKDLFAEFDHTAPEALPSGDVKYHQGFSSDITTAGGPVHLSLAFNPSHLEIVNPVVEGSVKARLDRRGDKEGDSVLPIIVHGDAAFAGQGVVMETLALAQTARLLHRRHGARRHQQPDRLHDQRPARLALDAVLHRRRQDDRGAGAARERRRPRGGRAVHPARARLPPGVQQGRGRRHRLLPQARPQRAGHAGADAAADVQEDRPASRHPQAVRREAGGAGRAAGRRARFDGQGAARRDGCRQEHLRPGADQLQEQVRGRLGALPGQEVDRCSRHRAADVRDQAPGRAHHDGSRDLQGPHPGREGHRRPRRDGSRRDQRRLGHGRAPRVRLAGRQRLRGAPVGRRLRPRHVHAPPRGAARPEPREVGRRHLHAAAARRRRPGAVRRDRLAAVRGGGARLRVRLRERRAEHAGDLGSAVRRLRQRRAGRDRPVHRLRRSEVGPRQRHHADAAARLRRAGAGALVGAPRALHAACRRQQHAGRAADLGEPDLPRAAPPDGADVPQAADHHDAEVAAAREGRGLAAGRLHQGRVQDRDRRGPVPRSTPTRSSA